MAVPVFTAVPNRNVSQQELVDDTNTFFAEINGIIVQFNVEIVNINSKSAQVAADTITVSNAADAALAASNFVGAWASLTGALNVPAAVSHSGAVWLLLTDLADVTASEPSGVNSDWDILPGVYSVEGDPGITTSATDGVVTVTIDKATDTQLRAGTANKFVAAAEVYTANSPVALTDGATITPDFDAGRVFKVTLAGNRTLANPSNPTPGQSGLIYLYQDATGSRTLSFGSAYEFESGDVPVLNGAAGVKDILSYYVEESGKITCGFRRAVS